MSRGSLRILLIQIRNAHDPMRRQEVIAFSEALSVEPAQISTWDLLSGGPPQRALDAADIVLIGGSGDYSAAAEDPWLFDAFDALRELYDQKKPTFGSCWGFQAMARALGGKTITDLSRAELGALTVHATDAAGGDPCFGPLGSSYLAYQGHQDYVSELPPGAILLSFSDRVSHQAFTFPDRPIYATQFHPELSRHRFLERLQSYPEYIRKITGLSFEEFEASCGEVERTGHVLDRFVDLVVG